MIARHHASPEERAVLRQAAAILRRAAQVHLDRMRDPDFRLSSSIEDGEYMKCLHGAQMAEHLCRITEPDDSRTLHNPDRLT
jgi:hypothetical protein